MLPYQEFAQSGESENVGQNWWDNWGNDVYDGLPDLIAVLTGKQNQSNHQNDTPPPQPPPKKEGWNKTFVYAGAGVVLLVFMVLLFKR